MLKDRYFPGYLLLTVALGLVFWWGFMGHSDFYHGRILHLTHRDQMFDEAFSVLISTVQEDVSRGEMEQAKQHLEYWGKYYRFVRLEVELANGTSFFVSRPKKLLSNSYRQEAMASHQADILFDGKVLMKMTLWHPHWKDREEPKLTLKVAWQSLWVVLALVCLVMAWRLRTLRSISDEERLSPHLSEEESAVEENELHQKLELLKHNELEELGLQRYFLDQISKVGKDRALTELMELVEKLINDGAITKKLGDIRALLRAGQREIGQLEHLKGLVREVTGGHIIRERKEFDINLLVENLFEEFEMDAAKRRTTLNLEVDDQYRRIVLGDPLLLRQVLGPLIKNAVAFTFDGEVRLSLVTNRLAGRRIRFSVQDNGMAIDTEKLATQLDNIMLISQDGHDRSSIDLYIVNQLLKQRDEDLRVISVPGGGNAFTFGLSLITSANQGMDILPSDIAGEREVGGAENDPIDQLLKRYDSDSRTEQEIDGVLQVLVVDDSPENQEIIEAFLKKLPLEFTFVSNGQEAVERCRLCKYHLIFMDLQMPVMGGREATELIRQLELERKEERTPIIAISAYIQPEERAAVLKAGCDDCISKPVNQRYLIEIVRNFCEL